MNTTVRIVIASGFSLLATNFLLSGCSEGDEHNDRNGGSSGQAPGGGGAAGGSGEVSCSTSRDCPEDQVCFKERSRCVECLGTNDCLEESTVCLANVCTVVIPCSSSRDCGADQVCDKEAGYCVECNLDADCEASSVCVAHSCVPSCNSDKDCRSVGLVCDLAKGHCAEDDSGPGGSGGSGNGGSGGSGGNGSGGTLTCSDPLAIDDFEEPKVYPLPICESGGRDGHWPSCFGSPMPSFTFDALPESRAGSTSTRGIHFTWNPLSETSVGCPVMFDATWGAYDASAYSGVAFWARGAASSTSVLLGVHTMATSGAQGYLTAPLTISASWSFYELPFSTFAYGGSNPSLSTMDRTQLQQLQFIFAGSSAVDLWIDDLQFLP